MECNTNNDFWRGNPQRFKTLPIFSPKVFTANRQTYHGSSLQKCTHISWCLISRCCTFLFENPTHLFSGNLLPSPLASLSPPFIVVFVCSIAKVTPPRYPVYCIQNTNPEHASAVGFTLSSSKPFDFIKIQEQTWKINSRLTIPIYKRFSTLVKQKSPSSTTRSNHQCD